MKLFNCIPTLLVAATLCACGGGGSPEIAVPAPPQQPTNYTVGGTVSGLRAGETTVLFNNGQNQLSVSANGNFVFDQGFPDGSAYLVSAYAPQGKTCTTNNGSGRLAGANVTDVAVICSLISYTIGFSVNGLSLNESVTLVNNGINDYEISSNGNNYSFGIPIVQGAGYAVTVKTSPAGKTCSVTNGTGNNIQANVSNVAIVCSASAVAQTGSGQLTVSGFGLQRVGRSFNFRLPAAATPADGHPLIISLHGNGGTSAIPAALLAPADTNAAIIVAPQGLTPAGSNTSNWEFRMDGRYAANQAGVQATQGTDDVRFIEDLIDYAANGNLGRAVDARKVFVIGYSRGAGMAFTLYADPRTKNKIAAIAPISGTFYCDMITANNGGLNALPADADANCGEVSFGYYAPKSSLFSRNNPARILGIWGQIANGEFAATQLENALNNQFAASFNRWASEGGLACERNIASANAVLISDQSAYAYRQRSAAGATTPCAADITFLLDRTQGHVPAGYEDKIVRWFMGNYSPL